MGGTVDAKSEGEGKGTSFIINLKTHCIVRKCEVDQKKGLMNHDPFSEENVNFIG